MATATNTNTPAEPTPEPYHRGEGRPPTPDEQGLVPVPAPEGLTERQQRGADCVFCRHELVTGHVTNLGPRPLVAHGAKAHWYPRACKPRCAS